MPLQVDGAGGGVLLKSSPKLMQVNNRNFLRLIMCAGGSNMSDSTTTPRGTCLFAGETYSQGSKICSAGRKLECDNGTWDDIGECKTHKAEEAVTDISDVGEMKPALRNSEITDTAPTTPSDDRPPATCWFNGNQFTQGALVCSGGRQIICTHHGTWFQNGQNC